MLNTGKYVEVTSRSVVQGRNQGVTLKITVIWKTHPGPDSKAADVGKMPVAPEAATGTSMAPVSKLPPAPAQGTEPKQTKRKKSPVI